MRDSVVSCCPVARPVALSWWSAQGLKAPPSLHPQPLPFIILKTARVRLGSGLCGIPPGGAEVPTMSQGPGLGYMRPLVATALTSMVFFSVLILAT